MVVVQLEKKNIGEWKALLKAATEGSILEELGRDQVIEDADGDNSSVTCGRCGALVARARMEAHESLPARARGVAAEASTAHRQLGR